MDNPATQCLHCGHDFEAKHPDEHFCSETCAAAYLNDPALGGNPAVSDNWKGWSGRTCMCGTVFTARYAGQTICCESHAGLRRCGCGTVFEPEDGRYTRCPACRAATAQKIYEPTACGGCGSPFVPSDGRQKYCKTCSALPFHLRKAQVQRCPTCGHTYTRTHGPQQLHCCQECAWPAAWNGPVVNVSSGQVTVLMFSESTAQSIRHIADQIETQQLVARTMSTADGGIVESKTPYFVSESVIPQGESSNGRR